MSPAPANYPLHRPELFEALRRGDGALRRAMTGSVRFYRPHEQLIRADEEQSWVYRLRTGWVIHARTINDGRRQIISVAVPGDLIGLKSMLVARSPDSITCLTRVSVNAIDQARLRELAADNPDVALRLMFQLGEEERRLHSWIVSLGHCSAEERLAAMVLDLRERLRMLGQLMHGAFRLPLTQREMADYVGITDVHVNRVLRRLRESGAVSVSRGVVRVGDLNALERLASPVRDLWERTVSVAGNRHYSRDA